MMHSIFTVSILWPHAITAPYCVSLYSACSTGLGNTEHYVHTLHYLLLFCGGPMQKRDCFAFLGHVSSEPWTGRKYRFSSLLSIPTGNRTHQHWWRVLDHRRHSAATLPNVKMDVKINE